MLGGCKRLLYSAPRRWRALYVIYAAVSVAMLPGCKLCFITAGEATRQKFLSPSQRWPSSLLNGSEYRTAARVGLPWQSCNALASCKDTSKPKKIDPARLYGSQRPCRALVVALVAADTPLLHPHEFWLQPSRAIREPQQAATSSRRRVEGVHVRSTREQAKK